MVVEAQEVVRKIMVVMGQALKMVHHMVETVEMD